MKNILIFIYMFLSVVSLYGTLFLKQEEIFKLKNWYGVIANTLATIIPNDYTEIFSYCNKNYNNFIIYNFYYLLLYFGIIYTNSCKT